MKWIYICWLLIFIACNKDDSNGVGADTIYFGTFFGECLGESCIEIYKIEDGLLFEDSEDQYPSIQGNAYYWEQQPVEDYLLAASLLDDFPDRLYDEDNQTIGMPDAGDWGGVFLGKEVNGTRSIWLIDYMDQNIPDYLHEYTSEVKRIVETLK